MMPLTDPPPAPRRRKIAGLVLSVTALALIAWLTLRPHPGAHVLPGSCCILTDFVLNTLLFLPLGVGLALAGTGAVSVTVMGMMLSIGIELSQLWWVPGRFASAADVAANVIGALIGVLIVARWDRREIWWPRLAPILAVVVVLTWFLGAGWVLPSTPGPATWVVKSASGVEANLDGIPLPVGTLVNAAALRDSLNSSDSSRFEAILVTGPGTGDSLRLLEIVVGEGFEPFLVLSQRGDTLWVYRRLGMSWLGLRAPSLSIGDGLIGAPGDTVRISFAATPTELVLTGRRGSISHRTRQPLSPDLFLAALFHVATDSALWWRVFPSMISFVVLGLALARRPILLVASTCIALFLGPFLSGAAISAVPVLVAAVLGAVGGRRLARELSLFPPV